MGGIASRICHGQALTRVVVGVSGVEMRARASDPLGAQSQASAVATARVLDDSRGGCASRTIVGVVSLSEAGHVAVVDDHTRRPVDNVVGAKGLVIRDSFPQGRARGTGAKVFVVVLSFHFVRVVTPRGARSFAIRIGGILGSEQALVLPSLRDSLQKSRAEIIVVLNARFHRDWRLKPTLHVGLL